ncbi:MAG: helix-turn-helix transcriptional regulator [Candidatus Dormibacteraeota bacterium]|nr:helix-turn-helix transcriptional regulator [Candidatus Dormibacteraeota bacterium]
MVTAAPGGALAGARAARQRRMAADAIVDACRADLPPALLLSQIAERVARVVPHRIAAWSPLDAETMLATELAGPPAGPMLLRIMDNEFFERDFGKFAALARRPVPVASLCQLTRGQPERSRRYRELLRPLGFGDELRAVFRADRVSWGILCLLSGEDQGPFTEDALAFVAGICGEVGAGLRAALAKAARQDEVAPDVSDAVPGALLLSDDDTLESMSPEAERWLRMLPPSPWRLPLPAIVYQLARRARVAGVTGDRLCWTTVQASGGRWLTLHAQPLDRQAGSRRVVMIVQPARRRELEPLLLQLHALTPREQEVASLLVRGLATEEIARGLGISRHTVRDHLKAAFAKLGVSSRGALAALLAGRAHPIPHLGEGLGVGGAHTVPRAMERQSP